MTPKKHEELIGRIGMTDITKLVKRLRGYNWEYADVIAAADALEAQAKEMAEFSDTASKHVSFWVQIKHEQDARIADLEAALDTVVTFLEGNGGACLSNDDLVAIRAKLNGEKG